MKINSVANFGAHFTKESHPYLAQVKKQAECSERFDEYVKARDTILFNFPQGKITKEKSYPNKSIFSFNPGQSVQYVFERDREGTPELDSFIKLADEIRKVSI